MRTKMTTKDLDRMEQAHGALLDLSDLYDLSFEELNMLYKIADGKKNTKYPWMPKHKSEAKNDWKKMIAHASVVLGL